jgi:hypothetical protein
LAIREALVLGAAVLASACPEIVASIMIDAAKARFFVVIALFPVLS